MLSLVSMTKFPERLKKLRDSLNLSQRELARAVGISSGMISQYEAGKKTPTIDVLVKFAHFFEVSSDYLLGMSDSPKSSQDSLPPFVQEELRRIELLKQIDLVDQLRGVVSSINKLIEDYEGILGKS